MYIGFQKAIQLIDVLLYTATYLDLSTNVSRHKCHQKKTETNQQNESTELHILQWMNNHVDTGASFQESRTYNDEQTVTCMLRWREPPRVLAQLQQTSQTTTDVDRRIACSVSRLVMNQWSVLNDCYVTSTMVNIRQGINRRHSSQWNQNVVQNLVSRILLFVIFNWDVNFQQQVCWKWFACDRTWDRGYCFALRGL